MKNDPIFRKVAELTKEMSLAELETMSLKNISSSGLSTKDVIRLNLYFPSIKKSLVGSVVQANLEEAKNEMVNKLLLSATSLTLKEAQIAVKVIFDERNK